MSETTRTTRTIQKAQRIGGVVLTFVIYPLGLGLAGFSLFLLVHRVTHQHTEPPYWLMLTLFGVGLSPILWYFRVEATELAKRAIKARSGAKDA